MNIYEKIRAYKVGSEKELYNFMYTTIIRDDKITYLGLILQYAASIFPDKTALICEGRSVSYKDLFYYACQCSTMLKERGVKPNDRVMLLMENSIAFYVAYFGIIQLGAVVVPLNTFLHERELAHIINDAQPVLFICSSTRAEKMREYATDLPPMIDETALDLTSQVPVLLPDFTVTTLPFDSMVALLYTSGTTGFPKGVMLSSKNILTNVIQVVSRFNIVEPQRIFAVLPLFHSMAQNICVWTSILMGCTVIIVPKIDRRAILTGLSFQPTIFLGVPALFSILCLLKTAPLESVDYFFSGGDALPDKIRAAFSLVYGRKICSGYGITEASPVVSVDMDDVAEPTSCTGKLLVGVGCLIRDEYDNVVPSNTIGQVWLTGDTVMLGYYNSPELNAQALHDGRFATGDLAYLDENGKLVITGRVKDLIVNKGIKIYPQEVENIISLHPNVLGVGVIGRDDPDEGQYPVAYVQLRHVQNDAQESLQYVCHRHLAAYKIPRVFICSTEPLPTTATGKVDKKMLRKIDKNEQ